MYVKTLSAALGVLAAGLPASQPAAAQGRWELLGQRSVGFHVDRDVVSGRGQGRFQVIRICVANNAVQFREVEVEFANGERQQLPVNAFVRPGQCTANLDLRGDARRIDRVTMVYNSVPNFRGQATVSVYGLQQAMGPGPAGPGGTGQWDVIGRRNVSFHVERDTISGEGEGRFRAIRLCVGRNGVQFRDVQVVFRNGETHDVPVRRFVRPNECTPAFDLPGDRERRSIREVHLLYNTVPNFQGQATVTLFGLR